MSEDSPQPPQSASRDLLIARTAELLDRLTKPERPSSRWARLGGRVVKVVNSPLFLTLLTSLAIAQITQSGADHREHVRAVAADEARRRELRSAVLAATDSAAESVQLAAAEYAQRVYWLNWPLTHPTLKSQRPPFPDGGSEEEVRKGAYEHLSMYLKGPSVTSLSHQVVNAFSSKEVQDAVQRWSMSVDALWDLHSIIACARTFEEGKTAIAARAADARAAGAQLSAAMATELRGK